MWTVENPLEYTPMSDWHGIAVGQNYLILSGLAIRKSIAHGPVIPNEIRGTTRMLAAIDIEKGELAAKWYEPTFSGRWICSTFLPPMPNSGGALIWCKNELYHVTDVDFSKINFDDIAGLKNGWVGPADSGAVYFNISY